MPDGPFNINHFFSLPVKHFEELYHCMECCFEFVRYWRNDNRLMMNDNKKEVLLSGSAGSLRQLKGSIIHKGDCEINFSSKVKT